MSLPSFYETKPYKFQEEIVDKSKDEKFYGLFLEQGTGKSKVAIDTFNYLLSENKIEGVVIICPKSLIYNWLNNEIPKHSKIKDLNILVTNYENLKHVENFLKGFESILILDESSKIKNPRAQKTKKLLKLAKLAKYRRILTGTPVTQGVQDLFSQLNFLQKDIMGSYYHFKTMYLRTQRIDLGHRAFEKIVGYQNIDSLHRILDHFCSRVLKKDVLELPEKIYDQVRVPMTKTQREYYETLKNDLIIETEDGALTTPEIVTKMLRLQQICGGFFPLNDGEKIVEINPNPKINAVLDLINEGEKVIIWCRFLAEIAKLQETLSKNHKVVTYQGSKSAKERSQAVDQFQNGSANVFIGNPQTGGMGITLTSCHKVIYYSNDFSLENRLQSEDRVHRIGQEHPVTYIDILCDRSIDSHVLRSLKSKKSVSKIATDFVGKNAIQQSS